MPFPTPLSVLTLLDPSSPTTVCRSSQSAATLSPPLLSVRLSVTSRRNSAMLPLTSSRRCPLPLPPPPLRSLMNFLTARSSPLAMSVSAVRRHHHVPWYCWPYAEGNHRPCTIHHQDQDHCSTREEVLCLDRRIHPRLPLHRGSRCGSLSRNTMSAAHPLSTASASKC